ncbi:hypothetical protein A8C32_00755 [Flavivirga aquatica]|uniref:Glycosyl transferase family 1 n=1 Tax=Flavivirga aquatica TaxID=1849968 RepID=A0A1E5TBW7_9FLAO|nr:glycosyltransferase family 4 protein [Flavivirga aquatica]OEK08839.1 hypothetical protein A8C32_00755 [Flavivirga aquatica]
MNLAIFSINKKTYSETFITAHKTLLDGNIYSYYGSHIENIKLENSQEELFGYTIFQKIIRKLVKSYRIKTTKQALLRNSLLKNKIDVILVEYGTLAHKLLPLFRIYNKPFIVHFHGYDASVRSVIEECNNYKEVFSRARGVIAVSKVMKKKLLDLGCEKEKLHYNTYGPNDSFLNVKPNYEEKLLVGIGRFVDKKAPYLTILAFSKVLKVLPDANLVLAGDGHLLNTCKNLVEYLKINNSVSFPGSISAKEFKEILSQCRAFVQHSIISGEGDMEGTPVAIIEAQAASIPVISTLHAGIPDVVLQGETGILVDEKDVDGMAKGMIKLLENKSLAKQMGENGHENIFKNFTMSKHIDNLNAIIKDVIT